MLNARLIVVGGDAKAAEIPLRLPTTIGRGREATLTLPHPLVSRQHCSLFERDGVLLVRDLKSLNGTYVNSQRIEHESELRPNELLTIGNVTFRAVYTLAAEPAAANSSDASPDSSAAELQPHESVVEFDEVASSDADSEVDMTVPLPDRKTRAGKRGPERVAIDQQCETPPVPSPVVAADGRSRQDTIRPAQTVRDDSAHVLDDPLETLPADTPEHSVIAALQDIVAGVADRVAPESLSELRGAIPGEQASSVPDGIAPLDTGAASPQESAFSGIDLDQTVRAKVEPDESALGSFVRKVPR